MFQRARRAGIKVATATPAARVKMLIMASVTTMVALSRRDWDLLGRGLLDRGLLDRGLLD
jgi:hypothetical protein